MLLTMFNLAIATAILGFSPGPAVFATIGRALSQGLAPTYLFILGIILGDLFFAFLAMVGLAALAAEYTILFTALKILGGCYMIYLGIKSWKQAKSMALQTQFDENKWQLVTSGFLLTASNPKDLLFFVSFLPAFLKLESITLGEIFVASVVITITFLLTLSFYAVMAHNIRNIFADGKNITLLNRIAGMMLVVVGIIILTT